MLQPSRIKHTKTHKGRLRAVASRGTSLSFGSFGLKAEESSWVKANQLESARRVMTRFIQRGGKIWTRVFPDKPRTAKSAEVGMGGGSRACSSGGSGPCESRRAGRWACVRADVRRAVNRGCTLVSGGILFSGGRYVGCSSACCVVLGCRRNA